MTFQKIYDFIGQKVAQFLDKFKVKNPLLFTLVQSLVVTLGAAIISPTIDLPNIQFLVNINEGLTTDGIVGGILLAIAAALSPRTTALSSGEVTLSGKPKSDV